MKFYKFQSWHSGEKCGFHQNPRHFVATAAFASAEQFQSEIALAEKLLLIFRVVFPWHPGFCLPARQASGAPQWSVAAYVTKARRDA
ncbi:hypothetical protein [Desulfovibrio sp. 3_1_syn3]|uniref:hypothetical protein n=1 Tax=Desulfovibrio sp. 3_1_syn3 TaxID=457398 RepID=UPI0011C8794B|nr:hypothetical protein [Desulfovibrio sp. 3_1_syn3]